MRPHGAYCCVAVVVLLFALRVPSSSALTYKPRGRILSISTELHIHHDPSSISTLPYPTPSPTLHKVSLPPASPAGLNASLGVDICMDCITFMNNELAALEAIVNKIEDTDTCDKICGFLNGTDVKVCDVLCNTIGFDKFWKIFTNAGLNSIWACEMVNACKVGVHPAVTLTLTGVTPDNGAPGTTFEFSMAFTVINETGVGEAAFVVYYPTATSHELGYIAQQPFSDYTPGDYSITWPFTTNSTFYPGKYLVIFDMCSGACGNEPDLASDEYTFNITAEP
jgi:hypothetical protein